jgi:hypothetical protein
MFDAEQQRAALAAPRCPAPHADRPGDAALRRQLAFAITMYDSSAVIELPDDGEEPRDKFAR